MANIKYDKILLKLSGEAFLGEKQYGIDQKVLSRVAKEIKEIKKLGCAVGIIIGGGNIFRGYEGSVESGMDRATADYMGMLATIMNALALQDALEKEEVVTRVQSALLIPGVAEPYIRRRAIRHLEKGRVVIFAAGTGNPYFSTDTAAALRALEINCEVILKATKVNGVYDSDPQKNKAAKMFKRLSYKDVLGKDLEVMDHTAVSLCKDNKMPIVVFNLNKSGSIIDVIKGKEIGTLIS